jgi:hypothetical protein
MLSLQNPFATFKRGSSAARGPALAVPEIEIACFPSWLIPKRVLDELQPRLF